MWRGLGSFDSRKSSLSTWLFTIARNCLTDYFRAQGNKPVEVEMPSDFEPLSEAPRALDLRRDLRQALGGLGDREREIVSLKFGAAMTNRKIAQLLGISESNVGTILYRSLNKIKTQIEGGMQND